MRSAFVLGENSSISYFSFDLNNCEGSGIGQDRRPATATQVSYFTPYGLHMKFLKSTHASHKALLLYTCQYHPNMTISWIKPVGDYLEIILVWDIYD